MVPLLIVGIVIAVLAGVFALRYWLRNRAIAHRRQAMRDFVAHREQLAADFLAAAQATGRPRGLNWKQALFSGEPVFGVDRVSGEFIGLITATISFEAIPGGGMEEVEAVGNLRTATAIFSRRDGDWTTEGKAAFNLEPPEVLEKFADALAPYPEPPTSAEAR